MAACAIEVSAMTSSALRSETIESIGEKRLDEWNRWMNRGNRPGPSDYQCPLGKIQEQRVAAGSPGGGGMRDCPKSVEEVERIVRKFSIREKKLIDEYFSFNPREVKASNVGLTANGFWRAMQRVFRRLYSELY